MRIGVTRSRRRVVEAACRGTSYRAASLDGGRFDCRHRNVNQPILEATAGRDDPSALTSEALTILLRENGALASGRVESVTAEPMGQGVGFTGQLHRLHLRYSGAADGAPLSLIAKTSSTDPAVLDFMKRLRVYEREVWFYSELAAPSGLRTPRCYYAAYNPDTAESLLLLEDFRAARPGDNVTGSPPAEIAVVLSELAKFHAAWWEHPRLADLDWIPRFDSDLDALQDSYRRLWPGFVQKLGARGPATLLELGERFERHLPIVRRTLAVRPQTLAHNDFRLDNLLFDLPDAPLAVIDWQLLCRGPGVTDVAYFFCWCMRLEDRARWEDLLRGYHVALLAQGVRGYDFEDCRRDFRWGALNVVLRLVVAGGLLDFSSERGSALARAVIERSSAILEDLRVGELIPP